MNGSVASLLTHLACSECEAVAPGEAFGPCPACGAPLLCRYDLASAGAALARRPAPSAELGVFRWSALLPVRDPARRLSLGEGGAPIVSLPRVAAELGLGALWIMDEGRNPTGSFKARGLAVAVAAHAERGAASLTVPTAGNAGSAAAAHANRHGLPCRVVLPTAATPTFREEQRLVGARVVGVSGDLGVAGAWVRERAGRDGDRIIATFHEPFRVEGKKTIAFEIWERFGEDLPDAIVHPTGGGVVIVALAKAFDELREAGLLTAPSPRLVAAQVDTCAPVVASLAAGAESVEPWGVTRRTLAEGLRVPRLAGGRLVLAALRRTGGTALPATEVELIDAVRIVARMDGFVACAEGGVALAVVRKLRGLGDLAGARVLVLNTASVHKSPETLAAAATG